MQLNKHIIPNIYYLLYRCFYVKKPKDKLLNVNNYLKKEKFE